MLHLSSMDTQTLLRETDATSSSSSRSLPIDADFDADFTDALARLETYNKHLYRPNTYLHKWWARRCGSTFRSILKHLVLDEDYQDYYAPGGLEGTIILDPMMGGGTTVHEAIRLGANVIGADLDPIPVLQAQASLTKLPLAELEGAFATFFDGLSDTLASFYQTECPYCRTAVPLQYTLYGWRRRCDCGESLFVDSTVLRYNNDGSIISIDPHSRAILQNEQILIEPEIAPYLALLTRKTKQCADCGQPYREDLTLPYYRRYEPVVVVGQCPAHGLFFAPPRPADLAAIARADERREQCGFDPADFTVASGPKSKSLLIRDIDNYLDLFSSRQLLYLRAAMMGLAGLEPLARLNLALLVSTSLEFNTMLCGYKGDKKRRPGAIRHAFAYHAYSFPYTALENNPIYPARVSGTLQNLFYGRIVRGRTWAKNPVERVINGNGRPKKIVVSGEVDEGIEVVKFSDLQDGSRRFMLRQGSSADLSIPDNSVDYVITDPPYFDSVQYSDLAAFFRVWLRKLLPGAANWEYSLDEAAVDQQANGNGQYTAVLGGIFSECHRVLKDNGRLIFTFHHWNPKGWAALTKTLQQAGFMLVNRYVVHAENPSSVHIANQNALVHDVVLVLAPNESVTKAHWELPYQVNRDDSQSFCQDCGAVLGWMLNQNIPEDAVDARWLGLLSQTNTQMQLLEKYDPGV